MLRNPQPTRFVLSRCGYLLIGLGLAAFALLLALPGSIAAKTHLALHGICAQRPSHSLSIGGTALPLDARMTGIYLGAAVTVIWLIAAGNGRNTQVPPLRVVATLVVFLILLAADGFNALAFDLGLPHPYPPSNALRLVTGLLCGTAVGVALTHLQAATLWQRADVTRPVLKTNLELVVPLAIGSSFGALALTGIPVLYAPFALGLLMAAIVVFAILATITAALVSNRAWTYRSAQELWPLASVGLASAILLMAGLSALRSLLGIWAGLPQLT